MPSTVPTSGMTIDYEKVNKVVKYIFDNATEGDVNSVLEAIDAFNRKDWVMTIGDKKGGEIVKVIKESKPKVFVEIGGYFGYSAIKFVSVIKDNDESHYYTIEYDSILACVIEKIVKYAGLSHKITVLNGDLSSTVDTLINKYKVNKVDFLFIDHLGSEYLSDFKLVEKHKLLKQGSVVVADNVMAPSAPGFVEYLNQHNQFVSNMLDFDLEYYGKPVKDSVIISVHQ